MRYRRWMAAAALVCILLLGMATAAGAAPAKVTVAFMQDMPPYQFLDAAGRPAGMHIDILDAIADGLDLTVEYLPMATNSQCLLALKESRVNLVLGVITSDHGYAGQTTSEITSSPLCMVAPNSALTAEGELAAAGFTAAFQYGTADSYLVSSLGATRYIVGGSQREVVENHLAGRAGVMIGVKDSILYQLREKGLIDGYTVLHNYMDTISFAMAVPEGNHSLKHLLNNGIASLRADQKYETIWNKWIVSDQSEQLRRVIFQMTSAAGVLGLAVLGYGLVNARVKSALKRQVEEKTKEVTAANHELEKRVVQLENESDLRNRIIKYSPIGMVLFDKDFRATLVNRGACRLMGESREPTGKNVLELPVVGEILRPVADRVFAEDFGLGNNIVTLGEGSRRSSYRCNIHQVMKLGEAGGALLMVENVTREEQEKQELFAKEKQSALSRIIAGIAHEIKNPLMSIRTYAQLIESMSGDEEFQRSFAEFVPREAERINTLVEGLINYAKPVRGRVEEVAVRELIGDCLYLTQAMKLKGAIGTRLELDETMRIQVDKVQIQQVLINIIINGIESMERKLSLLADPPKEPLLLEIRAYSQGDQAVISIADSGEGMTPDQLRDCTEPFFTTKASGTGLGLSLSKQFVEENGGTLTLESSLGSYTRITITFRRTE